MCGYLFKYILCSVYSLVLFVLNDSVYAQGLGLSSDFSRHRIVQPTMHHARTRREINTTRHAEGLHHTEVTIKVNIEGEEYILDLKLNKELVSNEHIISYQKDGKTMQHKPKKEDLDICQYAGSVRDKPNSWAALSTCHGVRGVIYDGQQMRYIEPAESNEINSNHYVYDHADLKKTYNFGYDETITNNNNYYGPLLLKKDLNERTMNNSKGRHKREIVKEPQVRSPYNSNSLSRYVELVLVADHGLFLTHGSVQAVHRKMQEVANILNSFYTPLNIFIALVGVEVWTERDEISLNKDSNITLINFMNYRRQKLSIKNDNAQLITVQKFIKPGIGLGYIQTMCSALSCGVISNYSSVTALIASVVAHEMGHNFGMRHDDPKDCPKNNCIMAPTVAKYPMHWSSFNIKSLALSFNRGMDFCLRNKPAHLLDTPSCGNGFVEKGEECDCGLLADKNKSSACHLCCDPDTCQLRHNATCAMGECCDLTKCKLKSVGTICRKAEKQCDLPEYCTGDSEYCPKDVFKMDTTPCGKNEEAYCVRGSCKTHDDQCRLLWGPTGNNSHINCYMYKPTDCGYDLATSRYLDCRKEDKLCGRLKCQHMNVPLQFFERRPRPESRGGVTSADNKFYLLCDGVSIDVVEDDPGLVPDGAKCGANKMCLKQRCVSVESVRADIAALPGSVCPSDCNGHGVCNSEGHCHCDVGFSGSDCTLPGAGGSIHSGPASDSSDLRKFMVAVYIIFLGILPLSLIILLIYRFRNIARTLPKSSSLSNMYPNMANTIANIGSFFTFKNNDITNNTKGTAGETNRTRYTASNSNPVHVAHVGDIIQSPIRKPNVPNKNIDIITNATVKNMYANIDDVKLFKHNNQSNKNSSININKNDNNDYVENKYAEIDNKTTKNQYESNANIDTCNNTNDNTYSEIGLPTIHNENELNKNKNETDNNVSRLSLFNKSLRKITSPNVLSNHLVKTTSSINPTGLNNNLQKPTPPLKSSTSSKPITPLKPSAMGKKNSPSKPLRSSNVKPKVVIVNHGLTSTTNKKLAKHLERTLEARKS